MPGPRYSIAVQVQPRYQERVRARSLAALARRVLAAEKAPVGSSLGVLLAGDTTVRDLNRRFLGIDAPTDVLSFGLDSRTAFVTSSAGARQVGEVIISYPTAARQARAAGHAVDAELRHLLVHGVLHALGYDHQRPIDARRMRAREEELLGRQVH